MELVKAAVELSKVIRQIVTDLEVPMQQKRAPAHIVIGARQGADGRVVIEVRDNGIGFVAVQEDRGAAWRNCLGGQLG